MAKCKFVRLNRIETAFLVFLTCSEKKFARKLFFKSLGVTWLSFLSWRSRGPGHGVWVTGPWSPGLDHVVSLNGPRKLLTWKLRLISLEMSGSNFVINFKFKTIILWLQAQRFSELLNQFSTLIRGIKCSKNYDYNHDQFSHTHHTLTTFQQPDGYGT